jgi:linoleoyl-CoA desaturase
MSRPFGAPANASTKYARNIRYDHAKEPAFQKELKLRVEEFFTPRNGNKKGNALMWAKCFLFVAAFWGVWYALAFHVHSLPVTFALLLTLALLFKCIAYNVAHDAVHTALSGRPAIDDAIYWFTFNMLGPNAYLWRIRHNNAHHFFVNVPGCDVDIEATKMIRFAPHVAWRPIHRFQHLYASFMYMVFTLHWIFFKDFKLYFAKEFGNVTGLRHPWWRFAELIALKLAYVGYMIVIPCLMLPYSVGTVLAAFVGFHFFLSLYVTLTFVSSHIGIHSQFVMPDENEKLPHSFLEHALLTSIDFHPRNSVVGFFYGGFNSHVAHHMFPNTSSVHYSALSRIIRDTAVKHGLPYFELSLPRLFLSHYRYLKKIGAAPDAGRDHFMVPEKKRSA